MTKLFDKLNLKDVRCAKLGRSSMTIATAIVAMLVAAKALQLVVMKADQLVVI